MKNKAPSYSDLVRLLQRSQEYLGKISDTQHPGSLNLWLMIKQELENCDLDEEESKL